ncbi:hypothetical protein LXL04_016690 [Taraxacum kok-saghyz]
MELFRSIRVETAVSDNDGIGKVPTETKRKMKVAGRKSRRRGKQGENSNNGGQVTSFYVSNLPDGITKQRIKYIFTQFGRVVDIYIGGKRDHTGSIFVFVRFINVADPKALEHEMFKVRCEHLILKVNIARYQKQANTSNQTAIPKLNNPTPPLNNPTPPPPPPPCGQ